MIKPFITAIAIQLASLGVVASAFAAETAISDEQAYELAVEAYVWGMPLHISEQSRKAMTDVTKPDFQGGKLKAPMNLMSRAEALLDATFTSVPSPNGDTLYTVAWIK